MKNARGLLTLLVVVIVGLVLLVSAHVRVTAHEEAVVTKTREEAMILKVRADYAEAHRLAEMIRAKDIALMEHDSHEYKLYEKGDHYEDTKRFLAEYSELQDERNALADKYNAITFDVYGCTFETKTGLPETAEETLPCHL